MHIVAQEGGLTKCTLEKEDINVSGLYEFHFIWSQELYGFCFINVTLQAPPRAEVVKNLQNGIIINLLGMGLTLLGLQATVGALVAKSLTASAGPYLQGTAADYSPVLALDVFLVQVFYFCSYLAY